ncbi:sporulation integral membrane protein YtvI [Peribacillus acanthi]|uniref:sporulation integral membrane protein YtvI n=1 Tax=Peribacillus acanthi TaxID=2171554 RepID=UPI000D3E6D8B|nr:sporulation integral membrane protein YtvI [Peribacillus acanthi]
MASFFTRKKVMIICAILLLIVVCYYILPVSVPLFVAFFTAILLEPITKAIQKTTSINHKLSIIIVFIGFIAFIGISSYFIVTKVVTEVVEIAQETPTYVNEVNNAWLKYEKNLVNASEDMPEYIVTELSGQIQKTLNRIKNDLTSSINIQNATSIIKEIPNYMVSFLVYLIALFLFMLDLPRLRVKAYEHLSERTADKVHFMASRLSYVVFGFLKAQFLVSVIIFIVSLIGLWFIIPELALVMSLIIWIIDFIPLIGSIVILGPWALFHLITGDTSLGTQLAILAGFLLIIRRTVEPKVMGSHIGLSPLTTLIAMYLGLKLFGILGFIIGPLLLIAFNSAREAGIIKFKFKI